MSEKPNLNMPERRQEMATFSICPIQDEIDTRLGRVAADAQNSEIPATLRTQPFCVEELREMCVRANYSLEDGDRNDSYLAEVMVCLGAGDWLYENTSKHGLIRFDMDNAVMYGYVSGFEVIDLPRDGRAALCVNFEKYDQDISKNTTSYVVPMAIEDSVSGVNIQDAPMPIIESAATVDVGRFAGLDAGAIVREASEQGTIHSLLNLIGEYMENCSDIETDDMNSAVEAMLGEGYIESLDDMTAAFSYYLEKCIHESDAWMMDCGSGFVATAIGGPGAKFEKNQGDWIDSDLRVAGIEFYEGSFDRGVESTVYLLGDNDGVYSVGTSAEDNFVLRRYGDDEEDSDEDNNKQG